jgi:hypothetical protein
MSNAHARELHHLAGGHGADHRVAVVAARTQRRQHGRKWSSMNSIVAMTMSPGDVGAAALQRAVVAHSAAACTVRLQAGHLARSVRRARAVALARWLSIVTMHHAHRGPGRRSAAEVRFGIVEGLDGDGGHAAFGAKRSVLRRALPRTKNGIFCSSFSASGGPAGGPALAVPR